MNNNNGRVLVVDDNPLVLQAVTVLLEDHDISSLVYSSAHDAVKASGDLFFEAVLTDIKMPEISGIELLDQIHARHPDIPVILMTAYAELETAIEAIKKGAFDIIIKPFIPEQLINTVKKAVTQTRLRDAEINYKKKLENMVQERTFELRDALTRTEKMSRDLIHCLTLVSEYRDTDTGEHISRIGLYSNKLAEALEMPEGFVETITLASSMHDIGKIGIPDYILLKQGKLTNEEFNIMKTHTTIGEKILSGSDHPVMKMAALIAATHHERWDGTGYPAKLKGKHIPLEGMIAMIADQYDALRSKRPYKPALSHKETLTVLTEGDGRTSPGHFNPDVLDAFIRTAPVLEEIFLSHNNLKEFSNAVS